MKTIKFNDCEKCGYKLEKCKCKEMTLQQKISEIEKKFDKEFSNLFIRTAFSIGYADECKKFLTKSLQEIAHFTAEELRLKEIIDENEMDSPESIELLRSIFGYGATLNDLNTKRIGFNSALEEIKIKSEELFK